MFSTTEFAGHAESAEVYTGALRYGILFYFGRPQQVTTLKGSLAKLALEVGGLADEFTATRIQQMGDWLVRQLEEFIDAGFGSVKEVFERGELELGNW